MTNSWEQTSDVGDQQVFPLRVTCDPAAAQTARLRAGLLAADQLAITQQTTIHENLRAAGGTLTWRTTENPYLSAAQLAQLDDQGVIRPGAQVAAGDVLVSLVQTFGPAAKGLYPVRDVSWTVPSNWHGALVVERHWETSEGRRREFPRGLLERYAVTLSRTIPFQIGDQLAIGPCHVTVTDVVADEELPGDADLYVSPDVAQRLGLQPGEIRTCDATRVAPFVGDLLKARAVGPYSLITGTPLSRFGGATVTLGQLQRLLDQRQYALLAEFVSLRRNDFENRPQLKALAAGEPIAASLTPAAPESLFQMVEQLWGLGLAVQLRSEPHSVNVELRPATDAEIVARSAGVISKPETLNYRTFAPADDGLMCEKVFGPEHSASRRRTAGHLELASPIIPILWRMGSNSILSRLLRLTEQELETIVARTAAVFAEGEQIQIVSLLDATPDETERLGTPLGTGCEAIRALLERLPPDEIPPAFGLRGERFFAQTISLIPPDLRPVVMLANGNFATSDLNDMYRLIVNRNNRLRKLNELKAPDVILQNEMRQLQLEVDRLHANTLLPIAAQLCGDQQRPLRCLMDQIANQLLPSAPPHLDFSGQARGLANSRVAAGCVEIPAVIFDRLRLDETIPVLLASDADLFLARHPRRVDGMVICLQPSDAAQLLSTSDIVAVHRPITRAAIAAAEQLQRDGSPATSPVPPADWTQAASAAGIAEQIISAAASGRQVSMASLAGVLTFGLGPLHSRIDNAAEPQQVHRLPLPTAPPKAPATLDQMIKVIQGHQRTACLWQTSRATESLNPTAGRIGGLPWMPPGSVWPVTHDGEPYEFVGQFPLDVARTAGCLALEASPGSILTVFSNGDWNCCAATRDRSLVIHSGDQLQELTPPNADYQPGGLCAITPQLAAIFPSWAEAVEILQWELGALDQATVSEFRDRYGELFPNPADQSRIGGYPHWIQDGLDIDFVAQICTDGVTDLSFGDSGAIYIHGKTADSLSAFIQSY